MKNKSLIIAALLAVSVSVFGQKTLTILHTNDTHSCIMPSSYNCFAVAPIVQPLNAPSAFKKATSAAFIHSILLFDCTFILLYCLMVLPEGICIPERNPTKPLASGRSNVDLVK